MLMRLAPALFVLLWSTGWISGRAIAPYAEPLTFLSARFALTIAALGVLVVATRPAWPKRFAPYAHAMLVGILMNGIYMAAVWWVIARGLPTGVSGVIAALQPVLTAVLAPWLVGERLSALQYLGIVLGFAGIGLVLEPNLQRVTGEQLGSLGWLIVINAIGMIAVTFATFYQKRFLGGFDLRVLTLWQYVGALAFVLPCALALETLRIEWNTVTILTMTWSVLALSIGATMLLLVMIARGEVSRTATFIYLVPATVAIEAWGLFGETLLPIQIAGMVATVIGVALAVSRSAVPATHSAPASGPRDNRPSPAESLKLD